MLESMVEVFSTQFFMPHGHCYLWIPSLIWMQVLSNGIIAVSYVVIACTLAYLVYALRDAIPFKWMYLAFGGFIILCGITHIFDVYVIWVPDYWIDGAVRTVTAALSAGTALLLPPLIPHAMELARGAQAARQRGIKLETAVRELGTLYEKTKELDELKSHFFANVSHELRTPLALILGPLEKLASARTLEPGQRRDLEVVLRNARLLNKHVDDLLDTARLEAGKLKPEYVQTDIARLVRLANANFEALAQERGIVLSVEVPPSIPGQVDPDMLQRVVLNLLSNAFKFTPSGGRIRCSVSEKHDAAGVSSRSVVITVADSGPGIAPEYRDAVFERFRQLEGTATRRAGGTGLGLAIVKDLVELHRGRVSVDQALEGGASFTVELPLQAPIGAPVQTITEGSDRSAAEATRAAVEELRVRVDAIPSKPTKGRALVLVVEDNPDMNRFICDSLNGEFRTEVAFDGHEGLRKVIELRPDLVLTDVMMPGKSGDELMRDIRARADLDRMPVVLLTAKADDELRIQLLREGAQDYLTKPFSAEELRVRVGNLVTLKRAQDVLTEAKAAAESANQELQAFSYSVSHDLRAPLRGMAGFSQALLEDCSDALGAQGQDYLKRIHAAAQRMGEIIDGLLQLSKVSRKEIEREQINLSDIATAAIEDLERGEPSRQVNAIVSGDLVAYGDVRLIRLVMQNLVGNAWKFTRNAEAPRIEIGSAERDGCSVFFVRDNGAGFDMQHAGKLFIPFKRLHRADHFPGTGIGLATVQRIIARHGGRIWAESTPGAGATFWFSLPAIAEVCTA